MGLVTSSIMIMGEVVLSSLSHRPSVVAARRAAATRSRDAATAIPAASRVCRITSCGVATSSSVVSLAGVTQRRNVFDSACASATSWVNMLSRSKASALAL